MNATSGAETERDRCKGYRKIFSLFQSARGTDVALLSFCYAFNKINSKMPTDIMPSCRAEHFGQGFSKKTCHAEVKSGFLVLLTPGGIRQDVRVVVYRTSLEHFAVIYPRKRLSKPTGVVNLRNTTVDRADSNSGFYVRQKGYDNTVSARFLCAERDIDGWLSAFSAGSPTCQHATSLPVLVETEES